MAALRVAFTPLPLARWGPLFHVLLLEQPGLRLEWVTTSFPRRDRPLLEGADVGLFIEPPPEPGLRTLVVGTSPMAVVMAVGHRLAGDHELRIADVLDEPFPEGADQHPRWRAFWTLDAYRGGPPRRSHAEAVDPDAGLRAIVAGDAIATFPLALADGLPHPGVIALPLVDGPAVTTRLVWRAGETHDAVHALVDIARDMFGGRELAGDRPGPDWLAA